MGNWKSGSGKTFFSSRLVKFLKKKIKNKMVRRDKFRKKYSKDLGYSLSDRIENSEESKKCVKILKVVTTSSLLQYKVLLKSTKKKQNLFQGLYSNFYQSKL